jgi:hypothetical protein
LQSGIVGFVVGKRKKDDLGAKTANTGRQAEDE